MPNMFFQEGKKIKSFSGFHGKGFKFDETEAQLADERKKLQKAALGLQDSDDEESGVDVRIYIITWRHIALTCHFTETLTKFENELTYFWLTY